MVRLSDIINADAGDIRGNAMNEAQLDMRNLSWLNQRKPIRL